MVSKDGSAKTEAKMKSNLVFPKNGNLKSGCLMVFSSPPSAHIALHEGRRVEIGQNFVFSHCLKPLALGGFLVCDGLRLLTAIVWPEMKWMINA